jgi:hypothetical protein
MGDGSKFRRDVHSWGKMMARKKCREHQSIEVEILERAPVGLPG